MGMRLVWGFVLSTLIFAGWAGFGQQLRPLPKPVEPPPQPIAFSHKLHVGNGIPCKQCHPMREPGDFAEIAGTATCMVCHSVVKTDSPLIRKLREFHDKREEVPWEPVYLIPDYVAFNHKQHLEKAGAKCSDCHGPVEEREVLLKERDISMAACMDCHRAKGATLKCNGCHDQR